MLIIHVIISPPHKINHFGISAAPITSNMYCGLSNRDGVRLPSMFGPSRYRHKSGLIIEQKEAVLCSFISSATGYKLVLFIFCTDFWFYSRVTFNLLQSYTLLCQDSVVFFMKCFLSFIWWMTLMTLFSLLLIICHIHANKHKNSCLTTKSILSTDALKFFWFIFVKRNYNSNYLQIGKEGQGPQSAKFDIG